MRRDKNDKQWQAARLQVRQRDNYKDRCITHLNHRIAKQILDKANNRGLNMIDTCHIISVGYNPTLIYEVDNLILLNRYCHTCLDNYIDPITEEHITKTEIGNWWKQLLGTKQWQRLKTIYPKLEIYFNIEQ